MARISINLVIGIAATAFAARAVDGDRGVPPASHLTPVTTQALLEAVQRPYDELFDEAHRLEFSSTELARMREFFKESEKYCGDRFHGQAKEQERETKDAQSALGSLPKDAAGEERKVLQCRIQTARLRKAHADLLAAKAVPVAYQNRLAKLDLMEQWPPEAARIRAAIAAGTHLQRPHGDVLDIGFREIEKDQEKDVKRGKEAIDEMKHSGMLPREVENKAVVAYVEALTAKIAGKSDLRVPAKVFVLDSAEVNAFALPGGFLFIEMGLLDAVEDEAQLAGVIAHELSHAVARHGYKLMRRATIASAVFQAIQIATVLTTGPIGLGGYYALQYGFYGLGLMISLDLLGVSREFELEADQLGVQYAWNAGYDPSGFVRFFDRMSRHEGYVQGVSWFHTHPPFYERMVQSRREMMYLPAKAELAVDSTEFRLMKQALEPAAARARRDGKKKPSLILPEQECPKPKLEEVKPGVRIEGLCEIPVPSVENKP